MTVPRDVARRDELLHKLWQEGFAEMGPSVPSPDVRLPTAATTDYHEHVERRHLDDMLIINRYSDAHSGRFSTESLRTGWTDFMFVDQVISGSVRIGDAHNDVVLGPGMLCIRHFAENWRFSSAERTTSRILMFPKHALAEVAHGELAPFTVVKPSSPEARLLLAQLDTLDEIAESLSAKTTRRARSSTLHLVQGVLDAVAVSEADAFDVRVRAERYIDRHLRDASLGPNAIAAAIGVSPRTLHRIFAMSSESVMTCVRRRRLEQARIELSTPNPSVTIAYLAARWQFADAAHFSRAFRQRFGLTPTRYRERLGPGGR